MPRSRTGSSPRGDRISVEQQLKDCRPLPEIAGLGVAPSTVAREIKRNGVSSSPSFLYPSRRANMPEARGVLEGRAARAA